MVSDARDKEITLDDYVRYVDTGTVGKVLDLKTSDGIDWVKIDKTNLWYKSSLVEVLDEKDLNLRDDSNNNDDIDIESLKEKALDLENIELDSNVAEGGG